MLTEATETTKSLVKPTYTVTFLMLIIGQLQVAALMQIHSLKVFLEQRYFLSLTLFFLSFLSIQLYGFFYHIIVTKSMWVRILAGLWTYEVNTLAIMKPAKQAPYFSLAVSFVLTYLTMLFSAVYGHKAVEHRRGLFMSRPRVIMWSERVFVLTCFGIIVCEVMNDPQVEFPLLVFYTILSIVFSIIFSASMRRPNFYYRHVLGDYVLIGQLYYLNFFAMYMSIVWTSDSLLELMNWNINAMLTDLFKGKPSSD